MSVLDFLAVQGEPPRSTPALQQWLSMLLAIMQPVAHMQFGSGDHAPSGVELNALFPGEKDKAVAVWSRTDVTQVTVYFNNAGTWVTGPSTITVTTAPPGSYVAFAGDAAAAAALAPDYLLCDGSAVDRIKYSALFAVIGVTYGAGDLITTFNLPDLRGRTLVGLDNMGGSDAGVITGAWAEAVGGEAGAETHTLITSELPAHTHSTPNLAKWVGTGGGRIMAVGAMYNDNQTVVSNSTGGNNPLNNVQPSTAVNYRIKT